MEPFYITTPIYYVNDKPHLGHAYTSMMCDIMARFQRLDGREVYFLTGTDEHGQKIEQSAAKNGEDPQAFVDRIATNFEALTPAFNLTNNDFIRTSQPRHKQVVAQIWKRLVDSGNIYLGEYAGWYAVRDEAFYQEDELVNGKAPSGADVEWVVEKCYFFKLSAFQDKLLAWYQNCPDAILPRSRCNEVMRFVEGGLKDLCVSRPNINWGISVPGDDGQIIYVWLDALTNYLSALEFPGQKYQTFWPVVHHVVGKDILRFHAVYWPAFLMAADLPLPQKIFAHGWWMSEGQKMSKSIGNVVDPFQMKDAFGVDALRYYVAREVPFGQDGDFTMAQFKQRYDSELANTFGNLVQRVISFVLKNCDAKMPEKGDLTPSDLAIENAPKASLLELRSHINSYAFHRYIEGVMGVCIQVNKYIDEQAPWGLKKTDPARMATVLNVALQAIWRIALLLSPVIPDAAHKVLDAMGKNDACLKDIENDVPVGAALTAPGVLFPKVS